MEKEAIKKLAMDNGCTTSYSGKEKKMYIEGKHAVATVMLIKNTMHPLFEVVVQ